MFLNVPNALGCSLVSQMPPSVPECPKCLRVFLDVPNALGFSLVSQISLGSLNAPERLLLNVADVELCGCFRVLWTGAARACVRMERSASRWPTSTAASAGQAGLAPSVTSSPSPAPLLPPS